MMLLHGCGTVFGQVLSRKLVEKEKSQVRRPGPLPGTRGQTTATAVPTCAYALIDWLPPDRFCWPAGWLTG